MRLLPFTGACLDAEQWAGILERYCPPVVSPTRARTYTLRIPDDPAIRRAVLEAMSLPGTDHAWEDSGIGAVRAAALVSEAIGTMFEISMLGMMSFFASQAVPQGWIKMGTTVSVTDYPELAEVVPAYWLNDPFNPTHIILPQLAGLSLIPPGHYVETGYTHDYETGESAGAARHTLTSAEMPAHTHVQDAHNHTQAAHNHSQTPHAHTYTTLAASGGAAPVQAGVGIQALPLATAPATAVNSPTTATNTAATATNQQAGSGQAHNNMAPYAVFDLYIFAGR